MEFKGLKQTITNVNECNGNIILMSWKIEC